MQIGVSLSTRPKQAENTPGTQQINLPQLRIFRKKYVPLNIKYINHLFLERIRLVYYYLKPRADFATQFPNSFFIFLGNSE